MIFDLRDTRAVERLHREHATWRERGDIEALDKEHFVLVVCTGRVRILVA